MNAMERLHGRASDKTAVYKAECGCLPTGLKGVFYATWANDSRQYVLRVKLPLTLVWRGRRGELITFKDRGKQGGVALREQPSGPAPD